jgi:hypothetical protein
MDIYIYIVTFIQAKVIKNHENENIRYIGQGEARHTKYKRPKFGGSHVYGCSNV